MKTEIAIPRHISILRQEFAARTGRNVGYSLRAFARDLNLSAAALSGLLNLKKGVSEDRARDLARRIALSNQESEVFVLSAISHHARAKKARTAAENQLTKSLGRKRSAKFISSQTFEGIQNWYYVALLELVNLEGCKHSPDWFAARLGVGVRAIRLALEKLVDLKLLRLEKGRYFSHPDEATTDMDIPSAAIRNFHAQILKKADLALFQDAVHEREFLSATLAFSSLEIAEAKKAIRDFQRKFVQRFGLEKRKKDSVYQISIQLFRLDQKKEGLS